ncbi:MAG: M23 family metallopeptidase [Bacillota bacterium]
MVNKKNKRSVAFSDLRARLEEYAGMKDRQTGWYATGEAEGKRVFLTFYPFSALRQMHDYLLLKLALVFMVIALVFVLSFIKIPFSKAVLANIYYMTTLETDLGNWGREAMPALRRLWTGSVEEGLETVFAPGVEEPQIVREEDTPGFGVPMEGRLKRGFGLYEDPSGGIRMSYGLLLGAPDETPIYAAAAGLVKKIGEDPHSGLTMVLEHQGGMATSYGYLKEVLVKEREVVSQGQVIARAGIEPAEGGVVLYFEVRENGWPVDPLPLLVSF